jgi:protein phosphatase 2C
VANAGDSRAIILRNDGLVLPLTDDHKPDREDEKNRVEAAGGQILYWNGRRVMGVLAMSRAIGDQGLQPFVIPDPEITVLERRDDDELIIMGSDGIWDVLSNEETCQLAKRAIARAHAKGANSRTAAKVAATVLIRAALSKGSRDNITVIVLDLRPHPMDPEIVNTISRPTSAGRIGASGPAAAVELSSASNCSTGSGVVRGCSSQLQPPLSP